jgi:Gp5 N-terminal OB domain
MKAKNNFPGMDGFIWWTGIVENRKDPLKVGRVQVRIFGWHTGEKNNIPTKELLWAQPVFAANAYHITNIPKEGEMLFGFFMDGEAAQFPFYMGIIPSIPEKALPSKSGFADPGDDVNSRPNTLHSGKTRYPGKGELNQPTTSRSARNENMDQTPFKKSHGGKYPYVFSIQSECGHYIDLDDTPGKERITIIHRTGSRIDIIENGNINIDSVAEVNITAKGNVNVKGANINLN